MNILFFDTSSNILTVGVSRGGERFLRSVDAGKNGHTGLLLPEIDFVLHEAELAPSDMDAVAAVLGPGSFTGIRIGVATAAAFSRGTGAKKIGVTEFELISRGRAGRVTAAVEAGHGNLYFADCEDGMTVNSGFLTAEERGDESGFFFEPLFGRGETLASIAEAKAAAGDFSVILEPFYMRKSQAERTKDEV